MALPQKLRLMGARNLCGVFYHQVADSGGQQHIVEGETGGLNSLPRTHNLEDCFQISWRIFELSAWLASLGLEREVRHLALCLKQQKKD